MAVSEIQDFNSIKFKHYDYDAIYDSERHRSIKIMMWEVDNIDGVDPGIYLTEDAADEFIKYIPRQSILKEIPQAVINLEGYGRDGSILSWDEIGVPTLTVTKDDNLKPLSDPLVTDLSSYFEKDSDVLDIFVSGKIKFNNDLNESVKSELLYIRRL